MEASSFSDTSTPSRQRSVLYQRDPWADVFVSSLPLVSSVSSEDMTYVRYFSGLRLASQGLPWRFVIWLLSPGQGTGNFVLHLTPSPMGPGYCRCIILHNTIKYIILHNAVVRTPASASVPFQSNLVMSLCANVSAL